MINKRQFRIANDKKLLHKVGKHWVVLSAMAIALLGGGAIAGTTTAQANADEANQPKVVAPQSNNAQQNATNDPKAIEKAASQKVQTLMLGASNGTKNISSNNISTTRNLLTTTPKNIESNLKDSNTYRNLTYQYDTNSNTITFNNGQLSDGTNFVSSQDTPNDVKNASSIVFNSNVTINPKVTSLSNMFASDSNLKSITLGDNFNTKNVNDMSGMFKSDSHLDNVNLGHKFTTANVINMSYMFANDTSLPSSLTINSDFNTSSATNMQYMFSGDTSLLELSLPNDFDTTHAVQYMEANMFGGSKLQTLHINSSNTQFNDVNAYLPSLYKVDSNKTDADNGYTSNTPNKFENGNIGTFVSQKKPNPKFSQNYHDIYNPNGVLEDPVNSDKTISDWEFVDPQGNVQGNVQSTNPEGKTLVAPVYNGLTYKVSDAGSKPSDKNKSITFENGTLSNAVDFMEKAPAEIRDATKITFGPNIRISPNVTSMENMFKDAYNLQTLNFGNYFDTSNVTNMTSMFYKASSLTSITFPNIKQGSSYPTTLNAIVKGTQNHKKNSDGAFDTSNVKTMENMFQGDNALSSLTLPNSFHTSNVNNMENMFIFGGTLKNLQFPTNNAFDTSNVHNMSHMFQDDGMTTLVLPKSFNTDGIFNDPNVKNKSDMVSDMFTRSDSNPSVKLPPLQNLDIQSNDPNITAHAKKDGLPTNTANVYVNNKEIVSDITTYKNHVKDRAHHYQTFGYDNNTQFISTRNSDINGYVNKYDPSIPETQNNTPMYRIISFTPGSISRIDISTSNSIAVRYIEKDDNNNKVISTDNISSDKIGSPGIYNVNNIPGGYELVSSTDTSQDFSDISDVSDVNPGNGTKIYNITNMNAIPYKINALNQAIDINIKSIPKDSFKYTHRGRVTLNYYSSSKLIKTFTLPYSANGTRNYVITLLNPDNYIDNIIQGFDTHNFIPDSSNDYGTIQLKGNVYNDDSHTLSFNAQPVTEHINYVNGSNTVGSTAAVGSNYSSSNWTNTKSLSSDWVLSNTSSNPFSFSSNGTKNVPVIPKQRTDTLNYIVTSQNNSYKGSTGSIANGTVSGNDYHTNVAPTSFSVGNNPSGLPSGYSVSNSSQTFNYDGSAHPVSINPSIETENISYVYNGNTSVSSSSKNGKYAYQSDVTTAPSGWHIASTNPNNSFTYTYDTSKNTDKVNVDPNTIKDTVNYQIASGYDHSGSNVGTYNSNINDSRATQAGNNSLTINSGSASGLSSGYHVPSSVTIMNTTSLSSSNSSSIITVDPNSESETVNYSYGSSQISSASISSGYYGEPSSVTSAPSGWSLSGSTGFTFGSNSNSVNVELTPLKASTSISFSLGSVPASYVGSKGIIASSVVYSGNSAQASGASNTSLSFTSGQSSVSGLPTGFHIASTVSIPYNGSSSVVTVLPNSATENIKYYYHSGANSFAEGTTTMNGVYDEQDTINGSGISSGYHLLSNANNTFKYSNGSSSDSVSVVPNSESETVNYIYNDKSSVAYINSGYYGKSSSVTSVPTGWSLASGANTSFTFGSGNKTIDVSLAPSKVTDTIYYQYNNHDVSNSASNTFTGSDYKSADNNNGYTNNNFVLTSANATNMPNGYHLASANQSFNYDGSSHNAAITPNVINDQIDYVVSNNGSYAKRSSVMNSSKFALNDSRATSANNRSYEVTSTGNQYVPSGYHMTSNNVEIKPNSTDSESSNSTTDVIIAPDAESIIVNFNYGNNSIATSTYTGYVDGSTVASAPNHYSLSADQNSEINFSNYANGSSSASMQVVPTSVSDTIDYVSSADETNSLGSTEISGLYSTSVYDGTNNATFSSVPAGYTISGTPSLTYDAKSHEVMVTPITASADVQYTYRGHVVNSDNHDFHGNEVSDESVDITSANDSGIPANWQLASASTNVPFDNGKHPVAIKPVSDTVIINYQDNNGNNTGKSTTFTGVIYKPSNNTQVYSDNTFTIGSNPANLPNGYQLTHSTDATKSFKYDGGNQNVAVEPIQATDNVTYKYVNSDKGTRSFIGNKVNSYGIGNTTFDAKSNVPDGYHAISSTNFSYDNGNHTVNIIPNTINVVYKNGNNTVSTEDNVDISEDNQGTYTVSNYPANYHLAQGTSNVVRLTPTNTSNTYDISVDPDTETDTVNYSDANGHISNTTISGNYNSDVPQTTIDGSVPQHYHVVSGDVNNTYQPNGKINVTVAASDVTDHINFNGDSSAHTTKTGLYKTSGQVSAPNNYHFINGSNGQFTYGNDNDTHTFDVAPDTDTDTVNYVDNKSGQKVGNSVTISGNYNSSAKGAIDARQPDSSNWTIVSGDNVQFTPNETFDVIVSRNTATDTIEYQYKGQTRGTQSFGGNANSELDVTNGNAQLPNGYQLINNDNQTTYNGKDFPVAVTPKRVTENVTYVDPSGRQIGTSQPYTGNDFNAQGASDTSFNTNDHVPANYHAVGNTTFNYDDQAHTVTVAPNPETDDVNYIDSYDSHIKNTQIHGNYNSDAKGAIDAELPAHYYVVSGDTGVFTHDGTFNVNIAKNTTPAPKPNKPASGSSTTPASGSAAKPVKPNSGSQASGSTAKPTSGSTGSSATSGKSQSQSSSAVAPSSGSKPNSSSAASQSTSSTSSSGSSAAKPASSTSSASSKAPSSATSNGSSTPSKASSSAASKASSQSSSASQSSASVAPNSGSKTSGSTIQPSSSSTKSASSQASGSTTSSSSSATSKTSSSASSKSASGQSSSTSQSASQSSASVAPSSSSNPNSSSTSVAPSSSAASVTPYVPIMPSSASSSVSPASSVVSQSTQVEKRSSKPVSLTKMGYPITRSKNFSKPDVVTYMGRKYAVHYHANGKNTIHVREQTTKDGKRSYRYKNVVVGKSLPIAKTASDNLVRAVDHIDFNKVNKHVWTAKGLNKVLNVAKPGEVINYHGTRLAVVYDPIHWRYFMVSKSALAHMLVTSVGRDDTRNILSARHEYTIFIKHIVAVHGQKANYVRYEFSYHHHNFWVTARDDFVPNSYWQENDFRARHAHYVRVVRPCRVYRSRKYNDHTLISNIRRGAIVHVAKIVYINRPSYEQTRLVLDNGNYITANKNFIHIIK